MTGLLLFLAGAAASALCTVPLLRRCKKRLHRQEQETAAAEGTAVSAKAVRLAASMEESAVSVSREEEEHFANAQNQAAGMEEIQTTVDENARIAAEIADKTGSVASIAVRMEEDVIRGFSVLEKNVQKMGDIREKNSGVISGIVSLGNKVNNIRDIVRIINTITDQTKVIAFNAALEAAGAGETGKRFAVVAAEVNRLADDIAGLTRKIREQVEEIQSSSASLIMDSEEGSDRIAEGYKLIKDLEDIFREIRSGAEITSNQAQTITGSTRQQRKSSEQINLAMADVSRNLKTFTLSAEKIRGSACGLADLARELETELTAQKAQTA